MKSIYWTNFFPEEVIIWSPQLCKGEVNKLFWGGGILFSLINAQSGRDSHKLTYAALHKGPGTQH